MTAPAPPSEPPTRQPCLPWPCGRATCFLSEWIKLRSIRSNGWTLLIAAVVTVAVTALIAHTLAAAPVPAGRAALSPLTQSFLGYAEYGVLPVGILGVLAATSEYSTGQIATTLIAVPRRRAVLAAKAAAVGGAALVAGELLCLVLFLLTQAILAGTHRGLPLSHPGVPRAILGAGLLLAVSALTGLGLGTIIRHTAGAIAATVGVIYLLGALCLTLPAPWNTGVGRFTLPFAAYQLVIQYPAAQPADAGALRARGHRVARSYPAGRSSRQHPPRHLSAQRPA